MNENKKVVNEEQDVDLLMNTLNRVRKEESNANTKVYKPTAHHQAKDHEGIHALICAVIMILLGITALAMIPYAITTESAAVAANVPSNAAEIVARGIGCDMSEPERPVELLEESEFFEFRSITPETQAMMFTYFPEEDDQNDNLIKYSLPSDYYYGLDFWSFQPYMDWRSVTNTSAPAYQVCHSEVAYTDEYGFRRIGDDYVIALGTYYNEHGNVGSRWLIETTEGNFTAIVGDEKQDAHTDDLHMYGVHPDGVAGMIEYVVDTDQIPTICKTTGTMTSAGVTCIGAKITGIYRINEED